MAASEDALCIGDIICLYSEDVYGYAFSQQSSSSHSVIAVKVRDDREHPNVPDPQVIAFRIMAANRYKLHKAHEKLRRKAEDDPTNLRLRAQMASAKMAAEAEKEDNLAEQTRQCGKRLLYGQVLQLEHIFTGKYIHVSSRNTSEMEPSNMMVYLSYDNAKHAHFRVMPRYKVKAEGDLIQVKDQIILESIKSPGQFLHVSRVTYPANQTVYSNCYELNLSVRTSGFTVSRYRKPREENKNFLMAGMPIRLFHTELEAYLVAEGVFGHKITEDVHLRVRNVDTNNPKTLFPPTSAITYWQVEFMEGAVFGEALKWEQQVRLKHMCTRRYLRLEASSLGSKLSLIEDNVDPMSVFRLSPVLRERDEIENDTYCRIQHVVSGHWLHGSRDEYKSFLTSQMGEVDMQSMAGLKWSKAALKQITATSEMQYDDAFTIKAVDKQDVSNFNYMAGMVPLIQSLIETLEESQQQGRQPLNALRTHRIVSALVEIKKFMIVDGEPSKKRQKLLRNLKVVELLVRLLQMPIRATPEVGFMTQIFLEAYNVLQAYLMGDSRKNELYIAKHLDFFKSQISIEGEIGLNAAHMVMELVKDNRKIVDRIDRTYIDDIVELLMRNKNYRYLDLLNVLCVCDGLSISDNQTYITQKWLMGDDRSCVFHTDLGDAIGKENGVVFVSTDNRKTWRSLQTFAKEFQQALENTKAQAAAPKNLAPRRMFTKRRNRDVFSVDAKDEFLFLEHQLDLFGKLCQGRNEFSIDVITKQLKYLTWEEAFICLSDPQLPEQLRAKYCELIINLFVDVGVNTSVLDQICLTFVYDNIQTSVDTGDDGEEETQFNMKTEETLKHFPQIRDWIENFLDKHKDMTASRIGENALIAQVLRLLHYLVRFGYYDRMADIRKLLTPLLSLMDGRNDKPYPPSSSQKDAGESDYHKILNHYRGRDRFKASKESKAIVDAKTQAMEVLNLLFNFRFNTRLQRFISEFKETYHVSQQISIPPPELGPLLYENYDCSTDAVTNIRAKRKLQEMFAESEYFTDTNMVDIIMDLSKYEYDVMVTSSMWLLQRYFSAHDLLFKRAVLAQVLVTPKSIRVHEMLQDSLPVMRRLINSKMSEEQISVMVNILEKLKGVCCLEEDSDERHPMNQAILYNSGILRDIFDLISQDIDVQLLAQYQGLKQVFEQSFQLLKLMARGNKTIQKHLFDRMDTILDSHGAEPDLGEALIEVFTGNQTTCMKVLPHQIQKIMALAAKHTSRAPQFLDLLNVIVKVEELDLPLKRNQAYVMTYFMQYRSEIAYPLELSMDDRRTLLRNKEEPKDALYMVSLVDLLATCAEGENRFIESINQTIFRIDELLQIMQDEEIPNNRKKPFVRFLLWVYLNTAGGMLESGAGDIPHDKSIWSYFETVFHDIEKVVRFAGVNPDIVKQFMKKRPTRSSASALQSLRGTPTTPSSDRLPPLRPVPLVNITDMELQETITDDVQDVHETCHYLLEAVLPLLQIFFRSYYDQDYEEHPQEMKLLDRLAQELLNMCDILHPLIDNDQQMKPLVNAISALLASSTLPQKMLEKFQDKYGSSRALEIRGKARKDYEEYYSIEEELNRQLNVFAVNYSLVYGGNNTVAVQLGFPSQEEYTEISGDEELPLGKEFQEHISCFIDEEISDPRRRYRRAEKLIQQLHISSQFTPTSEKLRQEQEMLDIKSLQLLRGIIHNEIVKLGKESEGDMKTLKSNRKQLGVIVKVQCALNSHNALLRILPHLSKPSDDIAREVLSFLAVMLYGGNEEVQRSLFEYFIGTREEKFFFAIKSRIHLSSIAFKEQRALIAQHQAKIDEAVQQAKDLRKALKVGNLFATDLMQQGSTLGSTIFLQLGNGSKSAGKGSVEMLRRRRTGSNMGLSTTSSQRSICEPPVAFAPSRRVSGQSGIELRPLIEGGRGRKVHPAKGRELADDDSWHSGDEPVIDEAEEAELEQLAITAVMSADELDFKDEGYIKLVLRVLAYICDGQYCPLQNYLREQPDNIKSVNLISEVTRFLSLTYTSINRQSIPLVTQIFETLVEFTSGNRSNQTVVYENKICDYINYILRSENQMAKCGSHEAMKLKLAIGQLIMVMIEENVRPPCVVQTEESGDQSTRVAFIDVAVEMMDALDADTMKSVFVKNYELLVADKNAIDHLSKEESDLVEQVGFKFFHVLCRMIDLDRSKKKVTREKLETSEPSEQAAWKYYERKTLSVEVLKDNEIQKVYFLVRDKSVLREEVKQQFKYEVDRSSPSNKLRDFIDWSKEIIDDIKYQRRILSNKVGYFMVRGWRFFNLLAIFLSIVIAFIILIGWKEDTSSKSILIPVRSRWVTVTTDVLGAVHNIVCIFILVSYFLSNHPTFPSRERVGQYFKSLFGFGPTDDEGAKKKHLEVSVFSFSTFYILLFFTCSILGSIFWGYFFAFHLLHIAMHNQLLGRVILAITRNGLSLLWVLIYSLVFFYIYALLSFAFYRELFNNTEGNFCETMWACTVTVIHRGMIVGLFDQDYVPLPEGQTSFMWHLGKTIFDISFFIIITTIGLNIIFGIIVDTFSELRDSKWNIDNDMTTTCFICSRNAYDFEHHADGFDKHVRDEHNQWAYLFFFIHLDETRANDYTAIEMYVANQYAKEQLDFFPLNRSLALQHTEEDDNEIKMERLMAQVAFLVQKRKEEEQEKLREQEKQRQLEWEQKHRQDSQSQASPFQTF